MSQTNSTRSKDAFSEILALRKLEKLDPVHSHEERVKFLQNFKWDESLLSPSQQAQVEELLVKYNSIFARHRFDIGMNTDFKVNLTPQHEEPVYPQSLPTPTNLKDDLLVELALMQEYGIITTLPYSKYPSPIFAQCKPNGKLKILVDLRRINHLIKNDHGEQLQLFQTLLNTWPGKNTSVNLIVPRPTIAFQWPMSSRSNFCPLTLDLVPLLFLD